MKLVGEAVADELPKYNIKLTVLGVGKHLKLNISLNNFHTDYDHLAYEHSTCRHHGCRLVMARQTMAKRVINLQRRRHSKLTLSTPRRMS